MSRRRILISAFACRPGEGSEPGKGWACALAAARLHDVWVLTRGRYKDRIEEALADNPTDSLRFVYLDLPEWRKERTSVGRSFHFYYYFWQLMAYFVARRICRENAIEVIHHVSYSKYWAPSFVSLVSVPFVWGPVGGGETTPPAFAGHYGLRGRLYEFVRSAARWIGEHDPFVRLTARRSAISLATTEASAERMRRLGARNVTVYPAIGMTARELAELDRVAPDASAGVRFISLGRMLHWKGFELGIEAFARADIAGAEYWFVGDGPEGKRLELLAEQRNVSDRVRFLGRLGRGETLGKLGMCQALVHPSMHESGGLVCLESMAARRPVICLDIDGPAVQVSEASGIKVPVRDREQVISGLAAAMVRVAKDPEASRKMGDMGRRRVETRYLWDKKAADYAKLYEQAIGAAASRSFERPVPVSE